MTRRITDDELARRIVEVLRISRTALSATSMVPLIRYRYPETTIRDRLRALRDEGRVVEVAGPRGSLWRLP